MAKLTPLRRLKDIAAIAPIFGFLLLIPPVIGLFATEATVFGAPLVLVYLFAIWLALILIAAILSQRLSKAERDDPK